MEMRNTPMKRSIREYIFRLILLFVGLVISHLGVTLFLLTDLGADPFNVFIQGIFRTLGHFVPILTHGSAYAAVSILIMLLLLVVDKSYVKAGTLVCMAAGGPIIDVFTRLLKPFLHPGNPFVLCLMILALGCVILAFGMTIVIKSDAGTGPNDLVAIAISDTDTCSPVVSSISSSRFFAFGLIDPASSSSSSVVSPMADSTTTTSFPSL